MKRKVMEMMMTMRRLLSQSWWERYPYLSKLDKGIGPDPLPRSPPFLPAKSFSTKATFPVRAASSSSWSLPMVGNHQRILLPTPQPFQKCCAVTPVSPFSDPRQKNNLPRSPFKRTEQWGYFPESSPTSGKRREGKERKGRGGRERERGKKALLARQFLGGAWKKEKEATGAFRRYVSSAKRNGEAQLLRQAEAG